MPPFSSDEERFHGGCDYVLDREGTAESEDGIAGTAGGDLLPAQTH